MFPRLKGGTACAGHTALVTRLVMAALIEAVQTIVEDDTEARC